MSRSSTPSPTEGADDDLTQLYRPAPPSQRPAVPWPASPHAEIADDENTLPHPSNPPSEPPQDWQERPRETRLGIALSRTLRPLAARLESFSLVHALALAALVMAGGALYLARTAPPESTGAAAAPTLPESIGGAAAPAPPESTGAAAAATPHESIGAAAPIEASELSRPADPLSDKPAPFVATATARRVATKPPIDVTSLPIAPPRASQPPPRARPLVRSSAATSAPAPPMRR